MILWRLIEIWATIDFIQKKYLEYKSDKGLMFRLALLEGAFSSKVYLSHIKRLQNQPEVCVYREM